MTIKLDPKDQLTIQLQDAGIEFEVEYAFNLGRKWRFDFALPSQLLAIEIEGGLFGVGKKCPVCKRRGVAGHSSIQRLKSDMEKYNAAAVAGWRLLRFLPEEIKSGVVVRLLQQCGEWKGKEDVT